MSNLHDALKKATAFKKFEVDELLFVEYTCDPGGPMSEIWSHTSYFTYVVSGKMTLKTANQVYEIKAGESYFITKGGFIIPKFFDEVFCDMIIFIPDDFIRAVINRHQIPLPKYNTTTVNKAVIPLQLDRSLKHYYQSLFTYFQDSKPPSKALLRLKFEELIVTILTSGNNNELSEYLAKVHLAQHPSLQEIMENNYSRHLSMSEFARMSARSLSTFRRDFMKLYGISPGKWIKEKRLQLSRHLLEVSPNNIAEVAFESGFSSRTHFIRCFRERFHLSPHQFRQKQNIVH